MCQYVQNVAIILLSASTINSYFLKYCEVKSFKSSISWFNYQQNLLKNVHSGLLSSH